MSQKVRKTLIMIVMAALIICLMAASLTYTFTYGRYAGGKFDEESPYDDLIEFVGAREYTVRSPEELIQAIKDGYSNIVIAEDAEEPFVITEGVTDVEANLVLNLNGKVVVRNSRNPMLDVQTNVSVVLVYDSKQTGAFYNPVGSSLMASGGSLTVGSGGYESGPRAEEYENGTAAGTLGDTANATLFARSNETNNAVSGPTKLDRSKYVSDYSLVSGVSLPTITPKTTQENGRTSVRGNVYLSSNHSDWLPADTFLLYTIEKDCFVGDGTSSGGVTFESDKLYVDAESETVGNDTIITASEFTTPLCNVASCDFYYYYPTGGAAGTKEAPQDYAVIYGYWDVKALARDDKENETDAEGMATALMDSGLVYPFAAVRMVEGEGIVRGGTFSNHFDVAKSYGIYAEGGTLSVSKNTTVDTTFTTGGEGVCIRVQSATGETTTTGEATTTGGSLTISGGEFSSAIGNTIEMSGGKMTVTKGTFTKDASAADTASTDNGSAIDIQGGTLTMEGSDAKSFTITGSHVNGIKSSGGGTVTAEHTTFSMSGGDAATGTEDGKTYGTDMFGINIDSGTVTANGCDITIYGTYSAGILSMGKNVDDSTVSVGAAYGKASEIKASEIKVYVPENKKLLSSAGISSEGGKIQLTGNVNIETNGLGITARGPIDITGGEATVTTTHGTGIYVSGATITNTATLTVKSNITSGWSWVKRPENPEEDVNTNVNNGIYVENGSIDASAGTLNVTHTGVAGDEPDNNSTTGAATKSYAVFVKGDAEGGSQETTVSIGAGTITGTNAGGVYVVGTSKQDGAQTTYTATVTLGGVNVTAQNTYAAGILTETGNVIINGNAQITSSALGIAVINGNVGIGLNNQNVNASVKATRATGVYVQGGTVTNSGELDVTSTISSSWENEGADFENASFKTSRFNGIFVNGGSLESTGTLNVTHTGVENDAFGDGDNSGLTAQTAYYLFKTKSYAVRVETGGSADTTVTIASGNIRNSVGGGVLVNGGKVTLGREGEGAYTVDENGNSSGLTIETTGYGLENTNLKLVNNDSFDSWIYRCTTTGGDAVKIDGGTLKILGGQYQTAHGNGIFVRGAQAAEEDAYAVEISGGAFRGYNSSEYGENADLTGPAQSYGIKIIGGKVLVNGGTFGSSNVTRTNGSAFFMGLPDEKAEIKIQMGNFYSKNTDAVATFRYTDIIFEDLSDNNKNINISVTADRDRAAVALQDDQLFSQGDRSSTVTINGGTYTANGFGVWYGCSQDNLDIQNGIFTGRNISGLYFNVHPTSNGVDHVTLSGGTYIGIPDDRYYIPFGTTVAYANGAIGAPMNDGGGWVTDKGGLGNEIQLNQIMPDNALAGSYSGKSSNKLCDTVSKERSITITLQ